MNASFFISASVFTCRKSKFLIHVFFMIADKIYGFLFTDLNIQPYRALCAYVFITEN